MNNNEAHILQSLLHYSEWRLMLKRKIKEKAFPLNRCDVVWSRKVVFSLSGRITDKCFHYFVKRISSTETKCWLFSETFIGVKEEQEENIFFPIDVISSENFHFFDWFSYWIPRNIIFIFKIYYLTTSFDDKNTIWKCCETVLSTYQWAFNIGRYFCSFNVCIETDRFDCWWKKHFFLTSNSLRMRNHQWKWFLRSFLPFWLENKKKTTAHLLWEIQAFFLFLWTRVLVFSHWTSMKCLRAFLKVVECNLQKLLLQLISHSLGWW